MYLTLALPPNCPDKLTPNFTPSRVKSPPAACHTPGSSSAACQQLGGHTHPSSVHCSIHMQAWGGREGNRQIPSTQVGIDNISFRIKTTHCQQSYLCRVTRQNTELRSVKTECGQRFVFCFFFSFTKNSLTFVAKCVRRGSPYALISGKFHFNILITTEKYYYIQHYGCPRCNF